MEINRKWVIIGSAVLAGIIIFIFLSMSARKTVDTTQILNDAKVELAKQYTAQIMDKDVLIKDYQSRLTVSEGKYSALFQKYASLQKEKENVKPPQTNAELRDRFAALGYSPLAIK